tara:strand:- start:1044 stop:1436 length:393 start_codon:yes stop_codon:yes gene_type:complete
MSFDSHSLERLKQLGRQLPKELSEPNKNIKVENKQGKKLHRIEVEENPQELFRALIDASTDGKIPPHLTSRLKQLEKDQLKKGSEVLLNDSNKNTHKDFHGLKNKANKNSSDDEVTLYSAFEDLLLEEDL